MFQAVTLKSIVLRLPSLRPPCSKGCRTLHEASYPTLPRPPSCQWPAASWAWLVPSTVAAVEAATAAAIDCNTTAVARSTTSQVPTLCPSLWCPSWSGRFLRVFVQAHVCLLFSQHLCKYVCELLSLLSIKIRTNDHVGNPQHRLSLHVSTYVGNLGIILAVSV